MFMKFGTKAIVNIAEIASVEKSFDGESLEITLKGHSDNYIRIQGNGRTKAERLADIDETFAWAWESICEWRRTQPDYDGVKVYIK
jgi:hypothetical protein